MGQTDDAQRMCVYIEHRRHPFQKQKQYTEQCGMADLTELRLNYNMSTQGLIHTLGHTPRMA